MIARFEKARDHVLGEIGKVIVGQREVLNQMLVALFARGHCLLIGVPGLAKTLMVRTLGSAVDLDSRRIQFTPDLMPSDITGTDILEEDSVTGKRAFRFHRGPIFTNLLLADEINRTPPKTQAALLEAMQEQRVTISGTSYDLPSPFMVLATQNPIEQEGTYPLPEAQLDRFMFCIHLAYPSAAEEQQVILDTTRDAPTTVGRVLDAAQVLELQQLVRQVPVSQHVALYALSLIRATRPNGEGSLDFVNRWVHWGAGTRAGQYLLLAAKTHVLLQGRFSVSCADVREYALPGPAPPHLPHLHRRQRGGGHGPDCQENCRRGEGAAVRGKVIGEPARLQVSPAGTGRASARPGPVGAAAGGRGDAGPAPLPAPRFLGGIRRLPRIHAGRSAQFD